MDELYVIRTGVLCTTYHFAAHAPVVEESMVPGILVGKPSGLAGLIHNMTVVIEQTVVPWHLDGGTLCSLHQLEAVTALVLKGVCCDVRC